jgi:flagellar capping protein FliD
MASIQSLGVGSGLLTSELVEQIIEAERAPVEARLNNKKAIAEAKISAFGEVTTALSAFDSSLQSLRLPSTFNASQVESSNTSAVTGTASSLATSGSYTVSVSQIAQQHSIASGSYEEVTSTVGTGLLTFRFGTIDFGVGDSYDGFTVNPDVSSRSISITANNNTLAGIRDAVNNANFGVQATIVDDGSGYRLVFTSKNSGAENSIEVTTIGSAGLKALSYNQASQNASLVAQTEAGTLDLATGGGLASDSLAFSFSYQGEEMSVVVASNPAITTTETALAAIQAAMDVQLVASGFAAGDVLAVAPDDFLQLETAEAGFDQSLEILTDGSAATVTGSSALSNGFDFSANNATFSITVDGGAPQAITINAVSASRAQTVSLINAALTTAGLNTDVTASLNDDNELVFTRLDTGSAASLEISLVDVSGTAGSTELGLADVTEAGLDGFGLNSAEGDVSGSVRLEQTIAAQDALFTVNGLAVSRSSNLVTGVVAGTTLNLKSVTSGPVTLSVTKDAAALSTKISSFVDSYNALKALADELTAFDPDAGTKGEGSLLTGDSTLRLAVAEINRVLRSAVTGLTGSVRSLADIGITTDQNAGYQLRFSATTFSTAFASNSNDILGMFATAGSTTDAFISYTNASSSTQAGTYDVAITRLATVGTFAGRQVAALAAGNIVIDDDNDDFMVLLNGVSANIELTQGTYATAAALAEHIQAAINGNEDLSSSGHSVAVSYNGAGQRFDIESNRYGSSSNIGFLTTDSTLAATLGLSGPFEGDYFGNRLAGLSTPNGLSSENFDTAVTLNDTTSFSIAVNGVSTDVLTVPGSSGTPVTYNTPDALIAAISAQIAADPAFAALPAQTDTGEILLAGQDFSAAPRVIALSLDGGGTSVDVLIDGDASSVSFGGETPGTLENTLAAIQDAIDATALNGDVTAMLDDDDRIYFVTTATGTAAQIQVTANGLPATVTGTAPLDALGFDFATSNASFDIDIDGDGPVSIVVNTLTSDADDTLAAVQAALVTAGVSAQVTASLDDADQLVLTYASGPGAGTQIELTNVNATAIAELGLANQLVTGNDGLTIAQTNETGTDGIAVAVSYEYDEDSEQGRFVFSTGNLGDEISFADITTSAGNKLGLLSGNNPSETSVDGVDVAGTINGIAAVGTGQTLVAAAGNVEAQPGFYLNAAYGNLASSTTGDTFRVTVDGILSNPVTLGTISNTSPAAVAQAMQTAINNSPALLAAGVSVTVDYDVNSGGFGIISDSTGSSSRVLISDLTGNAAGIFGFNTGAGALGRSGTNAVGTADAAAGLRLQVTGGALGARGSVSYIKGIAERLDTLLEGYLGASGLFAARTNALNLELETIAEKRVQLEERIARSEERLRTSFLANDKIISQLNSTSDFLTSQLSMLETLASNSQKK